MIVRRRFGLPTWGWRGVDELDRMRRQMDRLLGDISGGVSREPSAGVFPLANVTEGKEHYYLRAELPGVTAHDLDITITGDSLAIEGERKIPEENEGAKYHRREREAGKFNRIITLPGQVDSEKVEARCIDGVLTVVLPKAESAKPRQISIKTGS
jgi:HSP20 family protein